MEYYLIHGKIIRKIDRGRIKMTSVRKVEMDKIIIPGSNQSKHQCAGVK